MDLDVNHESTISRMSTTKPQKNANMGQRSNPTTTMTCPKSMELEPLGVEAKLVFPTSHPGHALPRLVGFVFGSCSWKAQKKGETKKNTAAPELSSGTNGRKLKKDKTRGFSLSRWKQKKPLRPVQLGLCSQPATKPEALTSETQPRSELKIPA